MTEVVSPLVSYKRIGLTDEQLALAKWGTGYGGKKHRLDPANVHRQITTGGFLTKTVKMIPFALCSSVVALDFVDSDPEQAERIEGLKPCLRCEARAKAEGLAE